MFGDKVVTGLALLVSNALLARMLSPQHSGGFFGLQRVIFWTFARFVGDDSSVGTLRGEECG